LRNEIGRQEKELKRLRETCKQLNEQWVKSKFKHTATDVGKDVLDMRDQIVTLTNLVKYSLTNIEERLYKIENTHYDPKELRKNKTVESRVEFK